MSRYEPAHSLLSKTATYSARMPELFLVLADGVLDRLGGGLTFCPAYGDTTCIVVWLAGYLMPSRVENFGDLLVPTE